MLKWTQCLTNIVWVRNSVYFAFFHGHEPRTYGVSKNRSLSFHHPKSLDVFSTIIVLLFNWDIAFSQEVTSLKCMFLNLGSNKVANAIERHYSNLPNEEEFLLLQSIMGIILEMVTYFSADSSRVIY